MCTCDLLKYPKLLADLSLSILETLVMITFETGKLLHFWTAPYKQYLVNQ